MSGGVSKWWLIACASMDQLNLNTTAAFSCPRTETAEWVLVRICNGNPVN